MEFLANCALTMGGKAAVAFRRGAFRYNQAVLEAMIENRLRLSFNYNIRSTHQFNHERNRGVFRWSNGIIEIPMSYTHIRDEMREFEFSNTL